MKKIIYLLIAVAIIGFFFLGGKNPITGTQKYEDAEIGISFEYPNNVVYLSESVQPGDVYVNVRVKDIGTAETPLDLDPETEQETIEALKNGEFGTQYDFPFKQSKQVRTIGNINAQDFLVLFRFELCNVSLERKLVFYHNDKEITITLYGPVQTLKEEMKEYFMKNKKQCGKELYWDFEMHEEFYQTLRNGDAPEAIQTWYDSFETIVETLEVK